MDTNSLIPQQGATVTLILRSVLRLGRRLRSERPEHNLSTSAIGLLSTLELEGPMPAVRLAALERLQAQSLSRLLSSLEKGGHIARQRSEHDRRELLLSITATGRQALHQDLATRQQWLVGAMEAALSPQEQQLLGQAAELMTKLADFER